MKLNLLGIVAVVVAIGFSSFTAKKTTSFYLTYKGTGFTEKAIASFDQTTTPQSHITGTGKLNWLKVEAASAGGPTSSEFIDEFENRDISPATPNNLLSDEVDVTGVLDVKQ